MKEHCSASELSTHHLIDAERPHQSTSEAASAGGLSPSRRCCSPGSAVPDAVRYISSISFIDAAEPLVGWSSLALLDGCCNRRISQHGFTYTSKFQQRLQPRKRWMHIQQDRRNEERVKKTEEGVLREQCFKPLIFLSSDLSRRMRLVNKIHPRFIFPQTVYGQTQCTHNS